MTEITPLDKLVHLEKDARDFGFDWPDQFMILDQAISECEEIRDAITHRESDDRVQEEIGDLLHTAISLCLFSGFDVEETLFKVTDKFGNRMATVKKLAQDQGLQNLKGQSTDMMLGLWAESKK